MHQVSALVIAGIAVASVANTLMTRDLLIAASLRVSGSKSLIYIAVIGFLDRKKRRLLSYFGRELRSSQALALRVSPGRPHVLLHNADGGARNSGDQSALTLKIKDSESFVDRYQSYRP
jgi:hypothetical protein